MDYWLLLIYFVTDNVDSAPFYLVLHQTTYDWKLSAINKQAYLLSVSDKGDIVTAP